MTKIQIYDELSNIFIKLERMNRKLSLELLSRYLNRSSQPVVRTDFNVPIKDGKVMDLNRIQSILFII